MRILWTVNNLPPEIAKSLGEKPGHAISWVDAMGAALRNRPDVELAIAAPGHPRQLRREEKDGVTYYLYNKHFGVAESWEKIIADFWPDIIHAYGTEQRHNMPLIARFREEIPIVISLQGIIGQYKRRYLGGLPVREILSHYTLQDLIWRNGIFAGRRSFYRQAEREAWMLRNVRYVEGRSDWDRAISAGINPDLRYHYCPRMIRAPFFDFRWDQAACEKHSIFVHQGGYPIKGVHFMLEALAILKTRYPDVKLYISGASLLADRGRLATLRTSGYARLIRDRIQRLGLAENIEFTGYLDAASLARKLSRVEVCAIPSVIENAPNALAEAMLVGMPCVAGDVGGNADMLDYGRGGLLYCHDEPEMLADRIGRLFEDPALERSLAEQARDIARRRHDPADLEQRLLGIYRRIIDDFSGAAQA